MTLNRSLWCSESQTNVLVPSSSSLADGPGLRLGLRVQEDMGLLLEGTLRLHGKFSGHVCGWWSKSQIVESKEFEVKKSLWVFRDSVIVRHVMKACG